MVLYERDVYVALIKNWITEQNQPKENDGGYAAMVQEMMQKQQQK